MPRLSTMPWDIVEHLKTEEDKALYLEAALEDGDPGLIAAAVGDIARASGRTDVIAEAGLPPESPAPTEPRPGDLDLAVLLRAIKALGLRLRVSARG